MLEALVLNNEAAIRSSELCALIVLIGLWEVFGTSRSMQAPLYARWLNHVGLLIIDNVIARLALPVVTVGVAMVAAEKGWGLFNKIDALPWLILLATVVALDLNNYFQHWLMHKVPLLWRVHRVHHSDIDVDWSTAFRFHPIEAIVTFGLQGVVILLLGAPPIAVVLYEMAFLVSAFFVHANVIMPFRLERKLRRVVITPDMHRIHHSTDRHEGNSNFGGIFAFWDRCLGTYCSDPQFGHKDMLLGLTAHRDGSEQNLLWLLKLPFDRGKALPSSAIT